MLLIIWEIYALENAPRNVLLTGTQGCTYLQMFPLFIGIDIWALKCSSSLRMRDMYIPINVPLTGKQGRVHVHTQKYTGATHT